MQQMQKKTYQIKTIMKTKQSQKMSKNRAKIVWVFLRWMIMIFCSSKSHFLWGLTLENPQNQILQFCKIILKNALIEEFSSKF